MIMKLKSLLMLFVLNSLLFTSCNDEMDDYVVVKLSPEFITITEGGETPMKVISAQPTDTSKPVYAIQIYENDSTYYYGLFDDVSKMEIALSTAKTYKFKVAAIKNGTGRGLKMDTIGGENNYYLPNKVTLGNKFIKGNLLKDIDLISSLKLENVDKDFQEIDAFFATKSITIEKGATNIDFLLLRMGFGIAINVDSLTSGDLLVFIGNDTIALNSQKTSAYTIRQFNAALSNFNTIHTNASGYADSILISVKWSGTNGTVIESERKYLFKRNYEKTININLNITTNFLNFEEWGNNTVTDIDGNVYKTIKIGNQVWMAENLKVTKYRDGTVIPNVTSSSTWTSTSNNAWCNYNNDQTIGSIYGSLYNVYVIRNSKNVSPEGWHVPTIDEWRELFNFLGSDSITVGKKVIETGTAHWNNNYGTTNESGLSILPSGIRNYNGVFGGQLSNNDTRYGTIGDCTIIWSSTIDPLSYGNGNHGVYFKEGKAYEIYIDRRFGAPIRCIKD